MDKAFMDKLDETINSWLVDNVDNLPMRWIKFLAYFYPDARVRKSCLKHMKVFMGEGTYANYGFKVTVNYNSKEEYLILIGNRVSIAPNVTIISESTPNNSPFLEDIEYVKQHLIKDEPVIIEDDVWIGASVTILPGVKIGRGSIVGAGSVVVKNVDPFTIVAGVPAKPIRKIN